MQTCQKPEKIGIELLECTDFPQLEKSKQRLIGRLTKNNKVTDQLVVVSGIGILLQKKIAMTQTQFKKLRGKFNHRRIEDLKQQLDEERKHAAHERNAKF